MTDFFTNEDSASMLTKSRIRHLKNTMDIYLGSDKKENKIQRKILNFILRQKEKGTTFQQIENFLNRRIDIGISSSYINIIISVLIFNGKIIRIKKRTKNIRKDNMVRGIIRWNKTSVSNYRYYGRVFAPEGVKFNIPLWFNAF